jgi:hypothetical protein
MCCTVQPMPGLVDYSNDRMSDRGSSSASPAMRIEEHAMHDDHPGRTLSKEELEVAEHLVDHSQGIREGNGRLQIEERNGASSPSKVYDLQQGGSPLGPASSFERARQLTPRSDADSSERNESGDQYRSQIIPSSETTPGGQVCR